MGKNLYNSVRTLLLTCFIMVLYNCSSNEDKECLKTITIPQFYWAGNQLYRYDIEQEVPCDLELSTEPVNIEPPSLENFTYELISFEYISNTGNNTSKLSFEVKLNNLNSYSVKGVPYFTMLIDGVEFSTTYAEFLSPSCKSILANSSCTVSVEIEENRDVGFANSIEILEVEYYLTN